MSVDSELNRSLTVHRGREWLCQSNSIKGWCGVGIVEDQSSSSHNIVEGVVVPFVR